MAIMHALWDLVRMHMQFVALHSPTHNHTHTHTHACIVIIYYTNRVEVRIVFGVYNYDLTVYCGGTMHLRLGCF